MVSYHGFLNERRLLEHRMIFGYYPEVALNMADESRILKMLALDYLYKDLLILGEYQKTCTA